MPAAGAMSVRPLPPCSIRRSTSSSTWMFQAKSYSPGLDDGAGGRHGVTPALELEPVEERPVRLVVVRVQLGPDRVSRLEVDDPIGPGADRLEVRRRLTRLRPLERLEDVLRDDAERPAEGLEPGGVGRLVDDLERVGVELVDARDVLVGPRGDRRRRRVGRILPGEHEVVRGEGLPVVPLHVPLDLPRDRQPVPRDAAVLEGRDLGRENRDVVALGVERDQRLVEDAGAVAVLHPDGQVRVEDGGALPPEDLQLAAAPAPGRGEAPWPGRRPRGAPRPRQASAPPSGRPARDRPASG